MTSPARVRCAGRGCRHAESTHDPDTGECARCVGTPRCRGWATTRAHRWREDCWEIWHGAHHPWWLAMESEAMAYLAEEADYRERHPEPTLRPVLVDRAGTAYGITAYTLAGVVDHERVA